MGKRFRYRIRLFSVLIMFSSFPIYLCSFDTSPEKSINSIIESKTRFSAGGRIFRPSYSADTEKLYVFAEDSRFYIFRQGRLDKKIKLTSSPLFPPAEGKDGTLYCIFKDRTLRAYNRGANLLWVKKLSGYPAFPPVVNSRGNIAVFLKNNIICSYSFSGRLRWVKEGEISGSFSPVSFSSGILFNDGEADKIISDRGEIKSVPEKVRASAYLSAAGKLFTVKSKSGADDYTVLSLTDSGFNIRWSAELKGRPCDIKIYGGRIFTLTDKGCFYQIDFKGNILKEKITGSSGQGRFTVLDKYIYLIDSGSSFIRLYTHNFDLEDRIAVPEEAVSGMKAAENSSMYSPEPVYTGENRIVFGGNDWILYFYDIPDSNPAETAQEDLYPESGEKAGSSESLYYIQELLKSGRYENKMKALSLIEELIGKGGYSEYEYEILDILFRLGTEGTVTVQRNSNSEQGGAVLRSRAAEMIYSAGTYNSIIMLRKMINAENDEYVIIKGIHLLGKAGSDPGFDTLSLFRKVLEESRYDKRICSAVVSAAENIAAYNGYLPKKYSSLLMEIMDIHSDDKLKNSIIRLLVSKQY